MWKFEETDYIRQTLSPAVTEFTQSARLPDVFARYGLPLEVSESSEIEIATKTVLSFWNKTKNNPKYERLLKVLIVEHSQIVKELSDGPSRESHSNLVREERLKQQQIRFKELDTFINTVAGKGYLRPSEKNKLVAKFSAKGLTEQEILARIKVPIEERVVNQPEQGLEESTRKAIRRDLATLQHKNLYIFLGLKPGALKSDLEQRHRELTSEWNHRKNDNKKTAAQSLLALIKGKLIADGLEKYEKALVWDVIDDQLRDQVEFAADDNRISRDEFEKLVSLGISFGISRDQTKEAILWLAHTKGAVVEQDEKSVDVVICAECRTNVPKENTKCTSCGTDLWIVCHKCTTRIAAIETACGKCGFVTADRFRVNLLIRKVHFALEDKQLDDALKFAKEAEVLWGRSDEVAIVFNKVEQIVNRAKSLRKEYDDAISQKRLLSARDNLVELLGISPHFRGWDGKTANELQIDFGTRFQKVESLLERARQSEREQKVEELIRIYQEIQNLAVDFDEVSKGFKKYPPEPPSKVTADVYDNGVVIRWSESSARGHVEYSVVRCENRPPATPSDGEIVATIPSNSFNDENVRPGSFVYYGVFTERGGAFSSGVVSNGVLAIKEVENFALQAGENCVHGSWRSSNAEGRVRALCGRESDLRKGLGREIQLLNPHAFTDSDLTNDQTYTYRVFVDYNHPDGQKVSTSGRIASATPAIPPKPIEDLELRSVNGELHFQWSLPPFGKVSVYRLNSKPEWEPGTPISTSALVKFTSPLRFLKEGVAVDSSIPAGKVFYTPFTIAGEVAVVGQTKSFLPAEEISGLVVEDFESYLLLRWKWSGDFQSVLVAWRHDYYPIDADDLKATKQIVTKGEYDLRGGFRISCPKKTTYKLAIFTITESEGKTVYSVGLNSDCRAEARSKSIVQLSYSLRRSGWWKWRRFVLSLASDENITSVPELVLVAKPGKTQPLDIEGGKVITRIENLSVQPATPYEFEFEMPKIKRPFFLRLFFSSRDSYGSFKLSDPPAGQLKVK